MKMTPIPTTVEDLRDQWDKLHDLDRAESVKKIKKPDTSIRRLAELLGHSESNLRNLLKAAKAPAADLELARAGKISTRELVKRAKQAAEAEAQEIKASQNEWCAREAKKWSTSICLWLQEQNLAWTHQETILDQTRRELDGAEFRGGLPRLTVPEGMQLDEIKERTRPKADRWDPNDSCWRSSLSLYFFVEWLGLWTLAAIRSRTVQDAALADALIRTQQHECIPKRKS